TIDRAKVMFMSVWDGPADSQVVSQGCPIEAGLNVVGGQGISAEENVDVSGFDEPGQRFPSSGVNDCRSPCKQYLFRSVVRPAVLSDDGHPFGDVGNDMAVRPLGRYLSFHEAEHIAFLGSFHGKDPDPCS